MQKNNIDHLLRNVKILFLYIMYSCKYYNTQKINKLPAVVSGYTKLKKKNCISKYLLRYFNYENAIKKCCFGYKCNYLT